MSVKPLKKILLVDDEQSILLSLSYVLKCEGVEVLACNEIEQAEEALASSHFDLVIADIRMSGLNSIEGLELLSYIKKRFTTEVVARNVQMLGGRGERPAEDAEVSVPPDESAIRDDFGGGPDDDIPF